MLINELSREILNKSNHGHRFVVSFPMMNQLMGNDATQRAKETNEKDKTEILRISLRPFQTEPPSLWIDIFAHYDKCPNPNGGFEENKELERNVKPFILFENFSRFDGKIFVITLSNNVLNWRDYEHKEHWHVELI